MAQVQTSRLQRWASWRACRLSLRLAVAGLLVLAGPLGLTAKARAADTRSDDDFPWLRYARIFILDAYTYPLAPRIEFDAEKLADTMVDMHANTLRVATSGNYWLIPGTQFATAPEKAPNRTPTMSHRCET